MWSDKVNMHVLRGKYIDTCRKESNEEKKEKETNKDYISHRAGIDAKNIEIMYCGQCPEDAEEDLPIGKFYLTRFLAGFSKRDFEETVSLLEKLGIKILGKFFTVSCCVQCGDYYFAFEINEADAKKLGWSDC